MHNKFCLIWKDGQVPENVSITEDMVSGVATVETRDFAFSFFLRDVSMEYPMFIPEYGVIVTQADDTRDYRTIVEEIRGRGQTKLVRRWEDNPDNSFARAAARTKDIPDNTVLGLSRDVRLFVLSFQCNDPARAAQFETIAPMFHSYPASYEESANVPVRYNFTFGQGIGCRHLMSRRLEGGFLPILHAVLTENDIAYKVTAFATLEKSPLDSLRGTDSRAASRLSGGFDATTEQLEQAERCLQQEKADWAEEETVLYYRIKATNQGSTPQYAWFTLPVPNGTTAPSNVSNGVNTSYDRETGFQLLSDTGRVFSAAYLDGCPAPGEEMAVLVKPGQCATLEFRLPHSPVSRERALALAGLDFEQKRRECREFWQNKLLLESAAAISLPERRIHEMLHAGFFHLDLLCYGKEPDGPVSASVGVPYHCIATESAPIVMFFESLGRHGLARRCIEHFLNLQRPDGSIMAFGGYTIETGSALFLACEHFRYTGDEIWARSQMDKLFLAYGYLVAWIERNKKEGLAWSGYGMLDGKTADPEDPFHSFMLNGYGYLGISRFAGLLEALGHERSGEVREQSDEFRENIREGLLKNMARSPLVPLRDGTWCPSVSPWTEYRGPLCLFAEGGSATPMRALWRAIPNWALCIWCSARCSPPAKPR